MAFLIHALQSLRVPGLICSSATPYISRHLHRGPLRYIPLPWLFLSLPGCDSLCHSSAIHVGVPLRYSFSIPRNAIALQSRSALSPSLAVFSPLRFALAWPVITSPLLFCALLGFSFAYRAVSSPIRCKAAQCPSAQFLCHVSQICAAHSFAMPPLLCLPPWRRWQASA